MTVEVDAPSRVDGVRLIGDMVGSGYRSPPALVRREDGQVLQLTPLLYLVLKATDGKRTCAEIADLIGRGLGRSVTERDVRTLVDGQLRPLGLVKHADGSESGFRRMDPLLSIKPRIAVSNPRTTRRLTGPFRVLFRPIVAVPVLVGFVAVVAWVFFERGLGASAYDAFQRPQLLLLVFVVAMLSGGFHEFGHAAATRYGGAQPGAMGAGLYLVWPAFYTDVTDSYRLGRGGRIRTDLGGLYFNAIVVVVTFVWWWASGWEALLLVVAVQVLQMVQQLLPLLRFDGYHLLADLAGVPDLYRRIRPTLLGLLPHRWKAAENRVLRPGARVLITFWVFVTVPMMALMLLAVIRAVPRLLGSAGSVIGEDTAALADAWRAGNPLAAGGHAVQVLLVALPVLSSALVLSRTGIRFFRRLLRWCRGSALKRVAAAAVTAAVITGLSWAWWPNPGTYRPIGPAERGLVTTLLPARQGAGAEPVGGPAHSAGRAAPPVGTAAQSRLSSGRPLSAVFQKGEPLPTKHDPALAMVLVPGDLTGSGGSSAPDPGPSTSAGRTSPTDRPATGPSPSAEQTPSSGSTGAPDNTWVFPFDKPLPPGQGDNQALAVATTDGAVTYDLAFALVWATGQEALNVNEAHAYASCTDCVAVAVAFQVVVIMDDTQVLVPQNLAVAANYDCYHCITAAIASQLVLSVHEEPGQEELRALGEVWNRLIEFAGTIPSRSLTDITAQLDAFKTEVVAILGDAPPVGDQQSSAGTLPTSLATTGSSSPTEQSPTAIRPSTESPPGGTDEPTSDASPTEQPSSDNGTQEAGSDPSPSEQPTSDSGTQEAGSDPSPSEQPTSDSGTQEAGSDPSPSEQPTSDSGTQEASSDPSPTEQPTSDSGTQEPSSDPSPTEQPTSDGK